MKKNLPEFKNEDDERRFWTTADSLNGVPRLAIRKAQEAGSAQTILEDHIAVAPGVHDRGSQDTGESPGSSVPVSAQGISRRATGAGTSTAVEAELIESRRSGAF